MITAPRLNASDPATPKAMKRPRLLTGRLRHLPAPGRSGHSPPLPAAQAVASARGRSGRGIRSRPLRPCADLTPGARARAVSTPCGPRLEHVGLLLEELRHEPETLVGARYLQHPLRVRGTDG